MSRPDFVPANRAVTKGRPGRPLVCSEAERATRIREAAEEVFATTGYGAATMEEIAQAAGMSKKTVYSLYSNKLSLLVAVVTAARDFPWEHDEAPLADPLDELRRRLLSIAAFILSSRQLRLTRLVISQAERAPELADQFHKQVMTKSRRYVGAALERARQEGQWTGPHDAEAAADMLIGAVLAELHISALLGQTEPFDRERMAARIDSALRLFGLGAN